MAIRERGEARAEVEGVQYTLRPTYYALAQLEDLLDATLEEIFQKLQKGRRSGLIAVIWCLLQDCHGQEIKTLKDAGAWIEKCGEDKAFEYCIKAMDANADEGPPARPPQAQPAPSDGETASPVLAASV